MSAMETAGKDDMPEDAERKGLGTPATRAGILEKLVSAGFLERKKSRKTVQLLPSHDAVSLITVLPEQLQSPLLTAEWEYRLGEIERGQLAPEEFLDGISTMLGDLVGTYQVINLKMITFKQALSIRKAFHSLQVRKRTRPTLQPLPSTPRDTFPIDVYKRQAVYTCRSARLCGE